jgi:hypothetical protein
VIYDFAYISGCTIVYAQGDASSTAAHYSGQIYKPKLTQEMQNNIETQDGGKITRLKIFFAKEGGQEDRSKLTVGQAFFVTQIKSGVKGAAVESYVYNPGRPEQTTVMLYADGSYVIDVSDAVTPAG